MGVHGHPNESERVTPSIRFPIIFNTHRGDFVDNGLYPLDEADTVRTHRVGTVLSAEHRSADTHYKWEHVGLESRRLVHIHIHYTRR